jgi:hypothetical protein
MDIDQLLTIERGFWFERAPYYQQHTSDDATFVFPSMHLSKDEGMDAADQAPRWSDLSITDAQLLTLSDDIAVLSYHAQAIREGASPYRARITTVYRLEHGEPKLVFHQQTPDNI